MAKLTNKFGMPMPVVEAVARDPYTHGRADISTTTLIAPPRIRQLRKRYDDFVEEDVTDRIWSLVGQVGHAILERAAGKKHTDALVEEIIRILAADYQPVSKLALINSAVHKFLNPEEGLIIERRFYMNRLGWVISGQVDLIKPEEGAPWGINDYKFTSVWSVIRGGKDEWASQLNIYAHLCRENDIDPGSLTIVPIFRDWKKGDLRKARQMYDMSYPEKQIIRFPIEMWSPDRTEEYILERVRLHQEAEQAKTSELPECSDKDRWMHGTTWAVKKNGGKRAVSGSVSETFEQAEEFLRGLQNGGGDYYIEKREGLPTRCVDFCNVAPFCTQHQAWEAAQTN